MSESSLNAVADMANNGRIEHLFPTPLFTHVLKDMDALNAELREIVLERERTTKSAAKSNIGGWQSEADLLTWNAPAVKTLGRLLVTAVEIATARLSLMAPNLKIHFELVAWAAVNRKGHYNTSHIHPGATWSGVYYVDQGDAPQEGSGAVLEFEHPVQAMVMNFFPGLLPSSLVVKPEAGLIVLFPSTLVHNVRIYQGERPRICIPFNARPRIEVSQ
jgi:uncharacterized protein (TIGR02466 family)